VIVSDQLVMLPRSLISSSTTHRFQVPSGVIPSKAERLTCPEGAGAGDGNSSVPGPA
jgi:hypothetical protein